MNAIRIRKKDKKLKGTVQLPASKSISNRLLIIRALSSLDLKINNLSGSGDTLLLQNLLEKIQKNRGRHGLTELDTGNAGTAMRFLTGVLSMTPGRWVLTGNNRMKQRPVGVLVDALKPLGASIDYLGALGYPPLLISGKDLHGGELIVDPGISSQFISSLLMIAPGIPGGLKLHLNGQPVSYSYVNMTIGLMDHYGVKVTKARNWLKVPQSVYKPNEYLVEADWSAAAFWYEAVALSDEAEIFLPGLMKESLQGDAVLAGIYQSFGVETTFLDSGIRLDKVPLKSGTCSFNFSDYPDIAPAVITTCAALGMKGKFVGLKSLKIKETDRVQALEAEFEKMGIIPGKTDDAGGQPNIEFEASGSGIPKGIRFRTYDDHRMAMTFAPLALKCGEVFIEAPEVVGKSYPGFWDDLRSAGFEIS